MELTSEQGAEHRRRFADNMSIPIDSCVVMTQPHGTAIAVVERRNRGPIDGRSSLAVDGLITADKGVYLVAKTADCLPIFYFDTKERVLGLAHAGWRGVVGKLPAMMVAKMMLMFGTDPKNVVIGIGPCLDQTANLVNSPILQSQLPEWHEYCQAEHGQWRIDLVGFTLHQLTEMGIDPKNIEVGGICTATHQDFYSAAQGDDGRFISIMGIRDFEHE